jgi:hypothetical protein
MHEVWLTNYFWHLCLLLAFLASLLKLKVLNDPAATCSLVQTVVGLQQYCTVRNGGMTVVHGGQSRLDVPPAPTYTYMPPMVYQYQ